MPSFLAPVTSPGGGYNLTVADFNHDSRADVAVVSVNNNGNYTVTVSLSNGDGTFKKASSTVVSVPSKTTLQSFGFADQNGDGNLDLISQSYGVGHTYYDWEWGYYYTTWPVYTNAWLGKGNGTFGSKTTTVQYLTRPFDPYPFFPSNPTLAYADFNHDGFLDQATVSASVNAVGVSLGNPDGTYQTAQTYAAGPSPGSIAAGDFNGDGWIDLVVVNSPSSTKPTFSVLFNDGNW